MLSVHNCVDYLMNILVIASILKFPLLILFDLFNLHVHFWAIDGDGRWGVFQLLIMILNGLANDEIAKMDSTFNCMVISMANPALSTIFLNYILWACWENLFAHTGLELQTRYLGRTKRLGGNLFANTRCIVCYFFDRNCETDGWYI